MAEYAALPPACLIISDGSIATLVAVWRETVCRAGAAEGSKPLLWSPAGLTAGATGANTRIAELAGVEPPISGTSPLAADGIAATRMLLAAGEFAASKGIGRIVWPVQFATADATERLVKVGGAFDRALLAARLLSVDTRQIAGQSMLIHTPLAELTDVQLLDVAADLDVPVGNAWCCENQSQPQQPPCGKCASCLRWLGAMKSAGIAAPVAQLPGSVLEDKPFVKAVV